MLSPAQLGVLQKEPLGGGKGSDPNGQTAESNEQPRFKNNLPNQSGSADEMQHFVNFPGKIDQLNVKCRLTLGMLKCIDFYCQIFMIHTFSSLNVSPPFQSHSPGWIRTQQACLT